MKTKIEYGLEGAFKVDLFSGGKFVSTSDWFSNFITQTGLMYPTIYNFVDCFRFLSIGSGTSGNYGGAGLHFPNVGTTGLTTPITSFHTNIGTQNGTYIGWQGYETGGASQESACGTSLTETGPRFFRAWSIPTGDINTTVNEPLGFLNIQEFMVSPSSGSDSTGNCAFSRIVRNLSIPNGYRAIVSYQLRVNVKNTGTTTFGPGTFQTGNADVSNDFDLVSGWANLSGYYRQVYFGLEAIDKNGAAYIAKYGAGLEPSLTDLSKFAFYLSPDNSEFDVSLSGGPQADVNAAYSADGLMEHLQGIPMTLDRDISALGPDELNAFYYGPATTVDFPDTDTPRNIRLGGANQSVRTPNLEHYDIQNTLNNFNYQVFQDSSSQPISYATMGVRGFDTTRADFGQKAIFSTRILKLPMRITGQNLVTGRKKTITRKTLFSPVSSLGYNTRFGSLVYAYLVDQATAGDRVYYPMMDSLFYDSSGHALMPHYRLISGIVLTNRGTGIADAQITILPSGENIQRYNSRHTFQGPYDPSWFAGSHPCIVQNVFSLFSGFIDPSLGGDVNATFGGGSGLGGVYGITPVEGTAAFEALLHDCGLTTHIKNSTQPTANSTIYWPAVETNSAPLTLSFRNILFYHPSSGVVTEAQFDAHVATLSSAPFFFCKPTGYFLHAESVLKTDFTEEGPRLLPLHGIPNNTNTNNYAPLRGGQFPGLSFDNGLELYFDITWSSPCGGALECNDPV